MCNCLKQQQYVVDDHYDILDFSKIEAGKLELEQIPYHLHQLVYEVFEIFRLQAQQKNLSLQINIDERLPMVVIGDPVRLRQVFFNLLSNAIKFTQSGSVGIRLQPTDSLDVLKATVWDAGIGIDEKGQKKLFTAFSQADTSTTRQFGGTGLGLAICARIVNLMQGRIWVESKVNEGAQFNFTFYAPKGEIEEVIVQPDASINLSGLRVLLVEDNAVNRLLATKLLEKIKIVPMVANDGVEAVTMTYENHYDIVLMDMQMPNMDGIMATQHIRAMTHIKQPVIIALTANALVEDQQRCLSAGMDGFISKPVNFKGLQEKMLYYGGLVGASCNTLNGQFFVLYCNFF